MISKFNSILPKSFPPAITIGLAIFLSFLYFLNFFIPINNAISFAPQDLLEFNLNKLSFYSMGHLSFLHLLFNVISLITPMSNFEKRNGTVYTGIILNLLTVSTGLLYALFGIFLYPNSKILGASGIIFSFLGWFAYHESLINATYLITPTVSIPTIYSPLIPLILIAIFVPGSSFLGHLFGLLMGYALALGYFKILIPKSSIIEWIEVKAQPLINLIPSFVKYYREEDTKYVRDGEYFSVLNEEFVTVEEPSNFQGQGHVLGA